MSDSNDNDNSIQSSQKNLTVQLLKNSRSNVDEINNALMKNIQNLDQENVNKLYNPIDATERGFE